MEFLKEVTRVDANFTDRQIPSILSYVDGEEFVGAQAKAQLVRNPKNTVAFFRDFLGQKYVAQRMQGFLLLHLLL
jgi:molecular chaperone DnaK (HSP70)